MKNKKKFSLTKKAFKKAIDELNQNRPVEVQKIQRDEHPALERELNAQTIHVQKDGSQTSEVSPDTIASIPGSLIVHALKGGSMVEYNKGVPSYLFEAGIKYD